MFKKIVLLLGILLFSNGAVANYINQLPLIYHTNNNYHKISQRIRNSEMTVPQIQSELEKGYYSGYSGKKCVAEVSNRVGKDRKVLGNDYLTMYNACDLIGDVDSWREEWINYDYANYKATPRELLISIYNIYIVLKACHSNREDYIIQYITDGEFEDIKQKMSNFEKSIKDSLIDISLENLWDSAMVKLKGAQFIRETKKETTHNEWSKFSCDGMKIEFYTFMDTYSTPAKLEKDF